MKRIISCVLLVLTFSLLLASCAKEVYKDDVTVTALKDKVVSVVGSDFKVADTYVADNFDKPDTITSKCGEYVFCVASSATNVDEFAIFHVGNSADVGAVKDEVTVYMNDHVKYLQEIVDRYDPSEASKLDYAEVYVAGNYVFYHLFASDKSVGAVSAFHGMLVSE